MRIKPTLILLLAGTIPVMTFVVERWMMRTYILPAMDAGTRPAAESAGQQPVSQ
jgi:hypothetical protein